MTSKNDQAVQGTTICPRCGGRGDLPVAEPECNGGRTIEPCDRCGGTGRQAVQATTNWRQDGFAVVTDSTLGSPLVICFHLTRWEADADLVRVRDQCGDLGGSVLEKPMASARVVPASLSFVLEAPANG